MKGSRTEHALDWGDEGPVGAGMGKDYKLQARSLASNLKDPANSDLQARVLHGKLTAHALVRLPNAELASTVRRGRDEVEMRMRDWSCGLLCMDTVRGKGQTEGNNRSLTSGKRGGGEGTERERERRGSGGRGKGT